MAWAGGATQQSERFHRRYGAVLGRGLSGPRRAQRAVHHDGSNLVFFSLPFHVLLLLFLPLSLSLPLPCSHSCSSNARQHHFNILGDNTFRWPAVCTAPLSLSLSLSYLLMDCRVFLSLSLSRLRSASHSLSLSVSLCMCVCVSRL